MGYRGMPDLFKGFFYYKFCPYNAWALKGIASIQHENKIVFARVLCPANLSSSLADEDLILHSSLTCKS